MTQTETLELLVATLQQANSAQSESIERLTRQNEQLQNKLQELLAQEMDTAWEQQKQAAKRLGEEAGTKLLLPLFLMLLVVMVLVMVPALMVML